MCPNAQNDSYIFLGARRLLLQDPDYVACCPKQVHTEIWDSHEPAPADDLTSVRDTCRIGMGIGSTTGGSGFETQSEEEATFRVKGSSLEIQRAHDVPFGRVSGLCVTVFDPGC